MPRVVQRAKRALHRGTTPPEQYNARTQVMSASVVLVCCTAGAVQYGGGDSGTRAAGGGGRGARGGRRERARGYLPRRSYLPPAGSLLRLEQYYSAKTLPKIHPPGTLVSRTSATLNADKRTLLPMQPPKTCITSFTGSNTLT
eukprot:3586738-Rhodomonas_salina.1